MRAAVRFGLHPRTWRAESVDDRGLMMSFTLFEAMIEARRQEWRDQTREKEEDRRARDENTFQKLKQRLKAPE